MVAEKTSRAGWSNSNFIKTLCYGMSRPSKGSDVSGTLYWLRLEPSRYLAYIKGPFGPFTSDLPRLLRDTPSQVAASIGPVNGPSRDTTTACIQ